MNDTGSPDPGLEATGVDGNGLPAWLPPLLRCSRCTGQGLTPRPGGDPSGSELQCPHCQATWPVDRGVARLLDEPHPAVRDERRAVAAIDAGEAHLPLDPGIRHRTLAANLSVATAARQEEDSAPAPVDRRHDEALDERSRAFLRHVAESKAQAREVLALRPPKPGSHVVELGADNCWAAELFLDAGCRLTAVDITDHLWRAEAAPHESFARLQADMNRLPLADGVADLVWANAAAHHSWDLGQTFGEAARVLKPGGQLALCCEPMPSWLRWPFGLAVADEERALGIHETWVPRRRWLRLARQAGFEARLVFPKLDDESIRARLESRGLPPWLAARGPRWIRPGLRLLQVSIHLVATLPAQRR